MPVRVQYHHFMNFFLLQNHCSNFEGPKIIQILRKIVAILGQACTNIGSPNHAVALGELKIMFFGWENVGKNIKT